LITEAVDFKGTTTPVIPETASIGIQGFPDSVHLLHQTSHVVHTLGLSGARVQQLKLHLKILKALTGLTVLQSEHAEIKINKASNPVGTANRRHQRIAAGVVVKIKAVDLIGPVCRTERQRGRLQITSEDGVLQLTDQNGVELKQNTGFATQVSGRDAFAAQVVVRETNEPICRDHRQAVVAGRIKPPLDRVGGSRRLSEWNRRPGAPQLTPGGVWITNLNNAITEDCRIQNDPSLFERLKSLRKLQRIDPRVERAIALEIQAQT